MMNIFRGKAARIPKTTEAICALAMNGADYSKKLPAVEAFSAAAVAGDIAPLATFLYHYMVYKRSNGNYERAHEHGLDNGYVHLLCRPAIRHIECSADGHEALRNLMADYPPFYRQMLMDLSLREAAASGGWVAVEALLAAGADANTAHGRPLLSATLNGYPRVVDLLLDAGADPAISRLESKNTAEFDQRLKTYRAARPPAPAAEAPPVLRLGKPAPSQKT